MWNAIEVTAEIRIYNPPMASVDQLVDLSHCVQRAAGCPIGILLRLQLGLENWFEHRHCCRLHNPIPDCWDDGFIMHLPLFALRMRCGSGLSCAPGLAA